MASPRSALARIAFLGAFGGLALGAASVVAQGPLPGDRALSDLLRSLCGPRPAWALFLTELAKPPWLWATLGVALVLAWLRGGARLAAAPALALLLAQGLDRLARAFVFVPRPFQEGEELRAASQGTITLGLSSGLPSSFALVFGALFGAVLLARRAGGARGTLSSLAAATAVLLIGAGSCARVVLAGHWTSQVLASLGAAVALAALACGLCARLGGGGAQGHAGGRHGGRERERVP